MSDQEDCETEVGGIAAALRSELLDAGFAFVAGTTMAGLLAGHGSLADWQRFAGSWRSLGLDVYLASRGHQRRRRHAVYTARRGGAIERSVHQPHFQSLQHNPLQGDLQRWFEPLSSAAADSGSLRAILAFSREFFTSLAPDTSAWRIELHQFRIEARADEPGQPTPEGVHRDGVDYVLVLLIDRHNIAEGTTTIHAEDGRELGHFTLTAPMDAALVDDARVFHGVTAVTPLDPAQAAHRDVLVLTFRALK